MTNKQLRQLAQRSGFLTVKNGAKHEIWELNGHQITLSRGSAYKSRASIKGCLGDIRRAVREVEEKKKMQGLPIKKEFQMQKIGDAWPKPESAPTEKKALSMEEMALELRSEGKNCQDIAVIFNKLGFTYPTTGEPFIAVTVRKYLELIGLEEETRKGKPATIAPPQKNVVVQSRAAPEPAAKTRKAYTTSDEKEAELTIKVLENILTTPDVAASKKLNMVKKFLAVDL